MNELNNALRKALKIDRHVLLGVFILESLLFRELTNLLFSIICFSLIFCIITLEYIRISLNEGETPCLNS